MWQLNPREVQANGMAFIRQQMAKARQEGNWKRYLRIVRIEIDMKKGRITLSQAVKEIMLLSVG